MFFFPISGFAAEFLAVVYSEPIQTSNICLSYLIGFWIHLWHIYKTFRNFVTENLIDRKLKSQVQQRKTVRSKNLK